MIITAAEVQELEFLVSTLVSDRERDLIQADFFDDLERVNSLARLLEEYGLEDRDDLSLPQQRLRDRIENELKLTIAQSSFDYSDPGPPDDGSYWYDFDNYYSHDYLIDYALRRPYTVMALGFDEYRPLEATHGPYFFDEFGMLIDPDPDPGDFSAYPLGLVRERGTGAWNQLVSLGNALKFVGPTGEREVSAMQWLVALRTARDHPDASVQSLWLPHLWTGHDGELQRQRARVVTIPLLQGIYTEGKSLADVHWRDLEELVAELLEKQGMKVIVTPRSRDGGRDIIARGEIFPGEPTVVAVEVKQKKVVKIEDLRAALYANRNFPALLVATAGTFSAAVQAERESPENRLRVVLKDGTAMMQWIAAYASRAGWPQARKSGT
jgi:Holliday junction resolvase-like predicted endonuclease